LLIIGTLLWDGGREYWLKSSTLISQPMTSYVHFKPVGPYPNDVYTNLMLIMKHKQYYDEIKVQKTWKSSHYDI